MDIFKYIKIYGNSDINEINTIDAMIFSRISYLHLENITDELPIKIKDLIKYEKIMHNNHNDSELLKHLINSKRYQNLEIIRFKSLLDLEKEEQFAATTIRVNDNTIFVTFRGTTKHLIAFKEDLNMSYKTVYAQIDALNYLNEESYFDKIYLGGHSKGGNLSMYAGINSSFWRRKQIKKIYNFDGPGFLQIDNKFSKMKEKIINYFPEEDIVGQLLYNNFNKIIVKTNKHGIESHNLYNWQIKNDDLVKGKLSMDSEAFNYANLKVITKIPNDKKKIIIDYIFDLFLKKNLKSIKDLNINDFKKIIESIPTVNKDEQEVLMEMLKLFLKISLLISKKSEKKLT